MILGWNTWASPDTKARSFMQATGISASSYRTFVQIVFRSLQVA